MIFDVAIVGGGPAGLFATYYAGLRGMRPVLLDSAGELGGQPALLYPDKWIYDVPGFPRVRARELVERLVEQALTANPEVRTGATVVDLVPEADTYRLVLAGGDAVLARGVVVAAGLGAFRPKRHPAPELALYEGRGVCYSLRSLEDVRGRRLVVVGGGDAAVDWALTCLEVAAEVTLVHRREQFRAHEESVRRLKASPVRLLLGYEVAGCGGGERLEAARLARVGGGGEQEVPCDVLLLCLGHLAELGPVSRWGFELAGNHVRVDHRMATNLPRVYASGDITSYPGKVSLIATAFAEAAIAVNHLKQELDPTAAVQPARSTG